MPGIKIYRYEGSLYYACAEHFRESIYSMTDFNPRKETIRRKRQRAEKEAAAAASPQNGASETEVALTGRGGRTVCDLGQTEDLHHVIVDCSTWSYIDYVGVKVMSQIIQEYRDIGVHVFLANPKSELLEERKLLFYILKKRVHIHFTCWVAYTGGNALHFTLWSSLARNYVARFMTDFCLSLLTAGIREMFNRCDFYEKVDQNIIYVSVHDAVQAALYEQRMRNKLKVSIE